LGTAHTEGRVARPEQRWGCREKDGCWLIRYDTTEEFNVDLKAEYTALSSKCSQKKC